MLNWPSAVRCARLYKNQTEIHNSFKRLCFDGINQQFLFGGKKIWKVMREKSRPINRLFWVQANKVKSDCNRSKPHNLFLKVWADVCRQSFEGGRLFQIISALVKTAHFQMKVVGIIAARFGRQLPWLNLSQFSLGASRCCRVSRSATSRAGRKLRRGCRSGFALRCVARQDVPGLPSRIFAASEWRERVKEIFHNTH